MNKNTVFMLTKRRKRFLARMIPLKGECKYFREKSFFLRYFVFYFLQFCFFLKKNNKT